MTDRHAGYVVTLAEDIREDDAEHIINAISMIKGVLSVEPVIASFDLQMATERAKADFRAKVLTLLDDMR